MAKNKFRFTFYYSHDVATEYPVVEFPSKNAFMRWAKEQGYCKQDFWSYGAFGEFMPSMPTKLIKGIEAQCWVKVEPIK